VSNASFSDLIPPASHPTETHPLSALHSAPPQSFVFIDALRGIAALLVVYFHLHLHGFIGYPEHPVPPGIEYWFLLGYFDLGKYAVATFFVISGFLIPSTLSGRNADLRKYIVHRAFRLYPAYWLAILVAYFLPFLYAGRAGFPIWMGLVNLTMFQKFVGVPDAIGVFWTLQIEITFYIFCAVLYVTKQLERRLSIVISMLVLAMMVAVGRKVMHRELPVALFIALALMFWGDLLRAYMRGAVTAKRTVVATAIVAVSLVPICWIGYQEAGFRYVTTYWAAMTTFLVAWRWRDAFPRSGPVFKVLTFLGAISYGVYLLGGTVGNALAGHFYTGRVAQALYAISASIVAAWLSFRFLEAPCIAMGKRIGKRWEPKPTPKTATPSR